LNNQITGARKNDGRIRDGDLQSISGDTHVRVKGRTQCNHHDCRRNAERNTQHHRVPREFAGIADSAGPKNACNGRDDAAAERTLRDGNHQRNQRKHRRDTGQGIDAHSRYEIDLEQSNEDLDDHHCGVGHCKPQDRGRDRLCQQHVSAGVCFHKTSTRLAAGLGQRKLARLR